MKRRSSRNVSEKEPTSPNKDLSVSFVEPTRTPAKQRKPKATKPVEKKAAAVVAVESKKQEQQPVKFPVRTFLNFGLSILEAMIYLFWYITLVCMYLAC